MVLNRIFFGDKVIETIDSLVLPMEIYINRLKSLEHSFSSREKWPESELNEWLRWVLSS
jgi:hypothetical protein